MAIREILEVPDPRLKTVSTPVEKFDGELKTLVEDMFETMYAANGRGLAAPQIGILKRVFVVDVSWKEGTFDPRVFINPAIQSTSGDIVTLNEQCLSIPDLPMPVDRPDRIQLSWTARDATPASATFDGILARCIQHEFDHLNGQVIFDHQSPENRSALEAAYAP